jgi:hypothetical protein
LFDIVISIWQHFRVGSAKQITHALLEETVFSTKVQWQKPVNRSSR